jgi:hypothetical protein
MLLAAACAAGLGASTAAAASQRTTATVKKISACGYVAQKAGTYELTQSVTDSGSGPCITIAADKVTLYLDSHTITGTGTDACIFVAGSSGMLVKDAVLGWKMPKPKAKSATLGKPAKLTNCEVGVEAALTSGMTVDDLTTSVSSSSGAGILGEEATGADISHITAQMHAGNNAPGIVLEGGADNVVRQSTVNYDGTQYGFAVENETGDTFMLDTVNDPYSSGGSAGTGFFDTHSSRNTWTHCSSSRHENGFALVPQEYGPVTVTYDTATGSSAHPIGAGFSIIGAFQYADSASPFHTLVSHNKTSGFQVGFDDENGGIPDTPVAEKWIDNTAYNYSGAGFVINYPTDYVMTGNIADANTSGKKYTSGDSYGFVLINASAPYAIAKFANNQAYDSEYGFYSAAQGVGGKGNIAKRNKINSVGVEIS